MMQKLYLMLREILSGLFITLIVFTAITAAAFSISSFLTIERSIENSILKKFEASIPPDMIKVSPRPAPRLGLFNFTLRNPASSTLNEESLRKIRAFKGVKTAYPLIASQIPMQAVISIFGLNYRTDLICIGAPSDFLSGEFKSAQDKLTWKNWKPGRVLPVLIPQIFLEAYNNSMAEPNGLPRITQDMAVGRPLQILFGRSSIKAVEGFATENSLVLGFTDKIKSICLVIPMKAVQYYNKKYKGHDSDREFMSAYIQVADHPSLLSVEKQIRKMGYITEINKTLSEEMLSLKTNVNMALGLMMNIILLLAVLCVSFSVMIAAFQRLEYYRILRILGASRLFITLTLLIKYALIGSAGSLAGFALMRYVFTSYFSAVKIQGFEIIIAADKTPLQLIISAGLLLSMLSAIPALFLLFTKRMSED